MLPPEILQHTHNVGWLLNWLPKLAGYAGRKYGEHKQEQREALENRIIDYLNRHGSSGIDGLWADVIIKPIIEDVPFVIAFPAEARGAAKFRRNMKALPYEMRHRWRMMQRYIPEDEFEKVLAKLVREGRIGYNRIADRYRSVQTC